MIELVIKKTYLDSLLSEASILFKLKANDSLLIDKIKSYVPNVEGLNASKKSEALISNVLFSYVKTAYFSDLKCPLIKKEFENSTYEINCHLLGNEMHYLVNVTRKKSKK